MSDMHTDLGSTQPLESPSPAASAPAGAPPAAPGGTEEQLFEVKADGQQLRVPLSELIRGYQRGSTFTRKTTELARAREQFASQVTDFQQLIQDRNRIRQYYQERFGEDIGNAAATRLAAQQQTGPTGAMGTDELLTASQVRQLLEEQQARLKQELSEEIGGRVTNAEVRQMAVQFGQAVDGHLNRLFAQHPSLARIPRIREDLKAAAREHRPQTLEETLELLTEYATAKAQALRELTRGAATEATVRKQELQAGGILPPGGAVAAPPAPQSFRNVKDPRLKEQILGDLLGLQE